MLHTTQVGNRLQIISYDAIFENKATYQKVNLHDDI